MTRRFMPFGTVSARPEFRHHAVTSPDRLSQSAAALFEALAPLVEAFEIDDGVFFLAWEIASMPRDLSLKDRKATLMGVLAMFVALRQGSTCLPLQEGFKATLEAILTEPAEAALGDDASAIHARWVSLIERGRLDAIVARHGEGDEYKPLVLKGELLYHQRMLYYEQRLIDALSERLFKQGASIQTDGIKDHLSDVWRTTRGELTWEQRYAALTCVHLPLTIITGGPGTGKTSTVVAILRLMMRLGVPPEEIALAAPTGKAAHRIGESIRAQWAALGEGEETLSRVPTPQTLHRLLGHSGHVSRRAHHHEHNPMSARVVIVDEASMIDLFLMEKLVRALRADAHLVLLGDADQLPSVEAGSVLRDLTAARREDAEPGAWGALLEPAPPPQGLSPEREARLRDKPSWSVRLTESHRMRAGDEHGGAILQVAEGLRRGDLGELFGDQARLQARYNLEELTGLGAEWWVMEDRASSPKLAPFLERWAENELELERLAELSSAGLTRAPRGGEQLVEEERDVALLQALTAITQRAKLLAVTRVHASGTRALNRQITAALRREHEQRRGRSFGATSWLPGTPVMITRNDYTRELFNGDQGIVVPGPRGESWACFARGERFVAFDAESLRAHLEICFAMTVHKSQGSEFERVALLLPPQPIALLTREVIYTAITRSRRGAMILGSEHVLRHGALTAMRRYSNLYRALRSITETM